MLIGKKVRLQPLVEEDDAKLVAAWFSDPAFMGDYFNVWPNVWQNWQREPEKVADHRSGTFLVRLVADDGPVGIIGYFNPFVEPFFEGRELWWLTHPDARKQGVTTQAACLLVNHLFDALPVERLQASIVAGNRGSSRVAEKTGFSHEGVLRRVTFLHGRYVDMDLYAITRPDWKNEENYRQNREF